MKYFYQSESSFNEAKRKKEKISPEEFLNSKQWLDSHCTDCIESILVEHKPLFLKNKTQI